MTQLGVAPSPTKEQLAALEMLERFMDSDRVAFVLLGAAGTGKTTMIRYLADRAAQRHRNACVLAPTGRAARVAGQRTGLEARTVHSHLYSFLDLETDNENVESSLTMVFGLRPNNAPSGTLYIVDEASMLSDREDKDGFLRFGSGRLLADLVHFAALHDREQGHQVVFVGDPAQLPPVGSPNSPALSIDALSNRYGVEAESLELTDVLRQQAGSGILTTAHRIRGQIGAEVYSGLFLDEEEDDVEATPPERAVPTYLQKAKEGGLDAVILIARTNLEVAELNASVRRELFGLVPVLVENDRLMIVQNNQLYHLFNGDFVDVVFVSGQVERRSPLKGVSLAWRTVVVREAHSSREVTAFLLGDLITSDAGNLTPEQSQALLVDFRQRHPNLKPKMPAFRDALQNDPYVNALRTRQGYALTCHKAQGGEWPTAIVVFDGREKGWANENYFRWVYTAITRTQRTLVAVRPPRHTPTSDLDWEEFVPPPTPSMKTGSVDSLLQDEGISITGVQDMPYRRRLTISRGDVVGRVDVNYDGSRIVKSFQPLGSGRGRELADEAIKHMSALVGTALDAEDAGAGAPVFEPDDGFFDGKPHLATLFQQSLEAFRDADIVVESIEHHQWMERYTVRRRLDRSTLDLYYNAKGRFPNAKPHEPSKLAAEVLALWKTL